MGHSISMFMQSKTGRDEFTDPQSQNAPCFFDFGLLFRTGARMNRADNDD